MTHEQTLALLLAAQTIQIAAIGWITSRVYILNRELGEVAARFKSLEAGLQRLV